MKVGFFSPPKHKKDVLRGIAAAGAVPIDLEVDSSSDDFREAQRDGALLAFTGAGDPVERLSALSAARVLSSPNVASYDYTGLSGDSLAEKVAGAVEKLITARTASNPVAPVTRVLPPAEVTS